MRAATRSFSVVSISPTSATGPGGLDLPAGTVVVLVYADSGLGPILPCVNILHAPQHLNKNLYLLKGVHV